MNAAHKLAAAFAADARWERAYAALMRRDYAEYDRIMGYKGGTK